MDLLTFLQNSERFETLMAAINTAELTELLSSGGPYLLLAPTNEAFAALPKDQLDALMADPEALAELLRNHIIEAYVPNHSYEGRRTSRTFTNLLGAKMTIVEEGWDYTVNGIDESGTEPAFVANGTNVRPVMTVLLPPE
jgi:uncharacterized surface protein with fasciclin (FAS1) repeats